MNLPEFQAKWRGVTLKERSAAQEHYLDLCRVMEMPTPAEADPAGTFYAFEKGAQKSTGGHGFADVWWKNKFGWEYKGLHADLKKAYEQLLRYREDLDNPPLLIVCDLNRFQVHTNFTGTAKKVYEFTLDAMGDAEPWRVLQAVFRDPYSLRPGVSVEAVTEDAARHFGELAGALDARGYDPPRVAHFLMQLLFCLFAEDVGLLAKGLFGDLLRFSAKRPDQFTPQITELFEAMRDGGAYALKDVAHFNGGLFATIDPLPLNAEELTRLAAAAQLDWGSVEPAIFGTLFERSLDPSKRAQLGAHYTGRKDIERVVEPVVMVPLRRRWAEVRTEADALKARWDDAPNASERTKRRQAFTAALFGFLDELAAVRILDPACGSGNFLYVALAALKDLEKEVVTYGTANGLPAMLPVVHPRQLAGLEINEYARELAQVVIWIGYLQWMTANGFQVNRDPVLEAMNTIRLQDALLDRSDPDQAKEACWPAADYIIGNPPFLGGNRIRQELGDEYLKDLFAVYDGRVPRFADLVCYFFEKARAEIASGHAKRAGLLATNSIRGGVNREVLRKIKDSGSIFMTWPDEPWVLEGAAVRISIVGFDDGTEREVCFRNEPVASINSDLTSSVDITGAADLSQNHGVCFLGVKKGGPFELTQEQALQFLSMPLNPNGRPNSDVVKPYSNGADLVKRPRGMWIIDFGVNTPSSEAAQYEGPFEYVRIHVKPVRDTNRRARRKELWWLFSETAPGLRFAVAPLERQIITPKYAKHRLFVWRASDVVPDDGTIMFARQDDYFFGVLHSRAHEIWSLRMGTWLGKGNDPRYTPTTCFETFPLPWPPGQEPWRDPRVHAIAEAARELDDKRNGWLNPPCADAATLKKRTLTNLYNQRPTWLTDAHAALDRAVWSAYGWDDDPAATDDETILARLLALNLTRADNA